MLVRPRLLTRRAAAVAVATALASAALAGPAQAAQHDPPTVSGAAGYLVDTRSDPVSTVSAQLVVPTLDCSLGDGVYDQHIQVSSVNDASAFRYSFTGLVMSCAGGVADYEANAGSGYVPQSRAAVSPGDVLSMVATWDPTDGLRLVTTDQTTGTVVTASAAPSDFHAFTALAFDFIPAEDGGTLLLTSSRLRFSRILLDGAPLSEFPDSDLSRLQMTLDGYMLKPGLLGRQNRNGSFFGITVKHAAT